MSGAEARADVDVLVVGAGPTGLTLALELRAQGVAVVDVVDAAPDAVHESRALAVQARTLEVLDRHRVADDLVAAGDRATGVSVHGRGRAASIQLFDTRLTETAYPFVLFLSQAETERLLLERLALDGVRVQRASTLVDLAQDEDGVTCTVRREGATTRVRARYVVGCDGAHSAVRAASGATFRGETYPQTFVLADLEADGIEPGRLHVFLGPTGMLFFFPLGRPATWRALTVKPAGVSGSTTLADLQEVVTAQTDRRVVVRDPVWMTDFSISERCVDHLRLGRVLLAGDAAHIHSPAGGQGMNTGIQDAVNLGWKLALVCRGDADDALLDSYEAERLPVARAVLESTGRIFRIATSSSALLRFLRPLVGTTVLPLVARVPALRRAGFRAVAELDIGYRRSPLSVEARAGRVRGTRAGDRVPDGEAVVDGHAGMLHRSLSPTAFTLALCGPDDGWSLTQVRSLEDRWPGILRTRRVAPSARLSRRLGLDPEGSAALLVRPDGHLGYRVGGVDLSGVECYLRAALRPSAAPRPVRGR